MKLRIEMANDAPDEVVIRCRAVTDEVRRLQKAFSRVTGESAELVLTLGSAEYFVPVGDILFFETEGDRVTAHTTANLLYSDRKLYELERLLPDIFVRVSKSCICNSARVSSIEKSLAGAGQIQFSRSHKTAYVSRMYYKTLRDRIYETRLSK